MLPECVQLLLTPQTTTATTGPADPQLQARLTASAVGKLTADLNRAVTDATYEARAAIISAVTSRAAHILLAPMAAAVLGDSPDFSLAGVAAARTAHGLAVAAPADSVVASTTALTSLSACWSTLVDVVEALHFALADAFNDVRAGTAAAACLAREDAAAAGEDLLAVIEQAASAAADPDRLLLRARRAFDAAFLGSASTELGLPRPTFARSQWGAGDRVDDVYAAAIELAQAAAAAAATVPRRVARACVPTADDIEVGDASTAIHRLQRETADALDRARALEQAACDDKEAARRAAAKIPVWVYLLLLVAFRREMFALFSRPWILAVLLVLVAAAAFLVKSGRVATVQDSVSKARRVVNDVWGVFSAVFMPALAEPARAGKTDDTEESLDREEDPDVASDGSLADLADL
jgi:hypothetical protein